MDEKNNGNLRHLEEEQEEEESDRDDAVSLSDYLTDDQEQQLQSSTALHCLDNDYSFEFPFNAIATAPKSDVPAAVNFFGYSFDDRRRGYLCAANENSGSKLILPVKSRSCRPPATESHRHDRRLSSDDSRKHKVLFGLAKIPMRMELSDIKKRQSRKIPAPVVAGETAVVGGEGGGRRHRSVFVVPFKQCRVHLASVLSFGCVSRV